MNYVDVERAPTKLDQEVACRLRASAQRPSPQFAHGLERRLLRLHEESGREARRRPLLAAAAAAAAMALVALGFSLAGQGPLAPAGDPDLEARDYCRVVPVTRTERVPIVVERPNGQPAVRYRERRVERSVERCP